MRIGTQVLHGSLVCGSLVLLALTTGALPEEITARAAAMDLEEGFSRPPDAAKPRVYWWWLNGLVSKEGITRDLEEFRAKGIGGVLLIDAGCPAAPMPAGAKFLGPAWRELFRHALREAHRLGLEVSANLCSGWCAGGPWITPQHACKNFVYSELRVKGPQQFSGKLPQPPGDVSSYRDVALEALREPPRDRRRTPRLTASSSDPLFPVTHAADRNKETYWVSDGSKPGDAPTRERPEWIQFEFPEAFRASTLLLTPRIPHGPRRLELEISADGRSFETVGSFTLENRQPGLLSFPETTSRFYRIVITSSHADKHVQVVEAVLGDMETPTDATLEIKAARNSLEPKFATIRRCVEAALVEPDSFDDDLALRPADAVDLTAKLGSDGRLDWEVPEGSWTVLRMGHTITGQETRCSSEGGVGLEIDWFQADAMDSHFQHTAELLLEDAGPLSGTTLKYFHDDSWEAGVPNWTQGFLDEFRRFRGYDARTYLPVLTGRTVVSAEVSDRFLHDYRKAIADCLAENHYSRFADLARARGVSVHTQGGGPCFPKGAPMDALKNLGRGAFPVGEFWQSANAKESTRGEVGKQTAAAAYISGKRLRAAEIQNQVGKQTASAAHIYGKRIAAAEAFTCLDPDPERRHWGNAPADLKPSADIAFCEGINRFFLHTATSTRPEDGKPGYAYFAGTHFNPNVTWWDQAGEFFTYIARCQYLLIQGLFVADVCYYNGDHAPNFVEPKHEDPSLGQGYDYDVCNAEVLLTRMSVKDGNIVLPDGMSYRLLVLPPRRKMPVEILRKVKDLVEAGATVVGPRPEKTPGLRDYPGCDDRVRKIAGELWGECDGERVKERRFGRGRIVWGKRLRDLLLSDGVKPDFEYAGGQEDSFLDFIHRRDGEIDIYFVANRHGRRERLDCTFRVSGKQPELWDPITGKTQVARAFRQAGGQTTLPLELAPHGSIFVVFRERIPGEVVGPATDNFPVYSRSHEIPGPWKVRFLRSRGVPESVRFDQLISWTRRPEARIKYFSGTATYHKTFDLPAPLREPELPLVLDLGLVKNLARVRLNGKDLGVVWAEPFRVDIAGEVSLSGNLLEIDVVNLWPNRLIGDATLPESERVTRTNVEFDKNTPLLDSGLLGPVKILAARRE